MGDRRIIPEPPYRRPGESEILAEAPAALSCVLWQTARHPRDWVDSSPRERAVLFSSDPKPWVLLKRREAHTIANEISPDLSGLDAFLLQPLESDHAHVATACENLARWAEAKGYVETSIQYAEVAALIDRQTPRLANLSGRLTRNAADFARAEVWFERGIGLARLRKDWVEYTRGNLGAGLLAMALGREGRARRHFNTASSIAMREGHEWLAAEAQHDLFRFFTVRGNFVDGELHARRALAWYPKHHPRFPFLVADVAFLLVCQHHFTGAARLLRRFVRVVDPPQNVLGYSLFVRALAGAGQAIEFERSRNRLLRLIAEHKEYEAAARWNLAHGEWAAGDVAAALVSARVAVDLARAQHDRETEAFAARLLTDLEAGTSAPAEVHRSDPQFRELVNALARRVAEWSPTRRGRARSLSRADWAA